jgi:hypothetical protein
MKFGIYIELFIILFELKIDKYYIYNFENFNKELLIEFNLEKKIVIPFTKKPTTFLIQQ